MIDSIECGVSMLIVKLICMLSKITTFVGNKENKGDRVCGSCNQPYAAYFGLRVYGCLGMIRWPERV